MYKDAYQNVLEEEIHTSTSTLKHAMPAYLHKYGKDNNGKKNLK